MRPSPATASVRPPSSWPSFPGSRALLHIGATIAALSWCGSASAQIAGRIGLQSDYLVRGASITRNRPAGTLDLSYDFPSGIYLNGSAFGALPTSDHLGLLGLIGDLGYARKLSSLLSVDGGVTRFQYMGVGANSYSVGYTEIYGGISARHLSARLYYSPDYYRSGVQTLYGEIKGDVGLVAGVRLNAHVGATAYLAYPAGLSEAQTQYDWLVGLSRQFGPMDLYASVSGGGPGQYYSYGQPRPDTNFLAGVGYTF